MIKHLNSSVIFRINLVILTIGLTLFFTFKPMGRYEYFTVQLDNQKTIFGKIYAPISKAPPRNAMILTHGINSSKEMMAPLAVELAKRGIMSVTFDFHNFGESYHLNNDSESAKNLDQLNVNDAKIVLNFVKSKFNSIEKIGIAGHSMGGTTALLLADQTPELTCTILLGIGGVANSQSPKNLLFATGLYEQLNPVWELRESIYNATNQKLPIGQLYGNFQQGNARKLVISSTSDHVTAPYNPFLLNESVKWVFQSFDLPVSDLPITFPWYIMGLLITFFSGLGIGIYGMIKLVKNHRIMSFIPVIGMIITGFLPIPPTIKANFLIFWLMLQLIANYLKKSSIKITGLIIIFLIYGLIIVINFIFPCLINGSIEIIKQPLYLLDLPQFLIQAIMFWIYNYTQQLKIALFHNYSLQLTINYVFFLLVIIELILPGIILTSFIFVCKKIIHWVRQPFKIKGLGKISFRTLIMLTGLLIILGVIIYQRVKAGFLAEVISRGLQPLQLALFMVILPLVIGVIIVRSPQLQTLEKHYLQ